LKKEEEEQTTAVKHNGFSSTTVEGSHENTDVIEVERIR